MGEATTATTAALADAQRASLPERLHVCMRLDAGLSAFLEEQRAAIGFPHANVLLGTLRPCTWPDQGQWEVVITSVPAERVKAIRRAAQWPKQVARPVREEVRDQKSEIRR